MTTRAAKIAQVEPMEGASDRVRDISIPTQLRGINQTLQSQLLGQEAVIELSLATFLAGGHLLLEGPPGVGKTSLAKSLSQVFQGSFHRVQMTSDLLPGEIVGFMRPSLDKKELEFRPGPVFTNFLLADELNRTSPKTQAALLEAMAEGFVTVDGISYALPNPFFVVATQNPLESHGVYPLAESQLDRFMLQVSMNFPSAEREFEIYKNTKSNAAVPAAGPALRSPQKTDMTLREVQEIRKAVDDLFVEESVLHYAHALIQRTRSHFKVAMGVSVRAGLQFLKAAKALALLRDRDYVTPKDLQELAVPALAHRLQLKEGLYEFAVKKQVISEILAETPHPR